MESSFDSFVGIITFIMNVSGISALSFLLESEDLRIIRDDLSEIIGGQIAGVAYVKMRKNQFQKILIPIFLLHFLNLGIFSVFILYLIIGPENISFLQSEPIAKPLSDLEIIVYSVYLLLVLITYTIRCILPTIKLVRIHSDIKEWISNNNLNQTPSSN